MAPKCSGRCREMTESTETRRFQCGMCFCEFFMPDGIEPHFCPHCSAEFNEVHELVRGEEGTIED